MHSLTRKIKEAGRLQSVVAAARFAGRGFFVIGCFVGLFTHGIANCAEWRITPRVSLAETWIDNVNLEMPGMEESDYVTEITPGINVTSRSRRLNLTFDYQLQNLLYARDSDLNDTYQQMQANADAVLIENALFVEASASMRQQNISNQDRIAIDNIAVSGNRSDISSLSVSPYWRHSFAGLVDTELRYRYQMVDIQTGASDGEQNEIYANVRSGRKFTRLTWNIDYLKSEGNRSDVSDVNYSDLDGTLRYRLTRKYSLLVDAGYAESDFVTTRDLRNGSYFAAGLGWYPSRRFSLEVTAGGRERVSVVWNPTLRTSAVINYRNQDVGRNPGSNLSVDVRHRTRRSTWGFDYSEEVETTQSQQFGLFPFYQLDDQGNIIVDLFTGEPLINEDFFLSITDDVFMRKRARFNVGYVTGKSNIRFSIFSESREFETSPDNEEGVGVNASWIWRFAPRTRSELSGSWRRDQFDTSSSESDFWNVRLGIKRRIGPRTNGSIDYTHYQRDVVAGTNEYRVNQLSVRLDTRF
jgi:hypothetical protein